MDWLMTTAGGGGSNGGDGPDPQQPTPPEPPPAAEGEGDDFDALRTNNEKLKHEISSLRGRLTKSEKELETTRQAQMSDQEKQLEEAFQRGVAETTTVYATKLLQQSVLRLATGKMADPTDAVKLLDLDDLDSDKPEGIEAAIEELLKAKPHLAVPVNSKGKIDQGPQGKTPQPSEQSGNDWLRSVAGRR
jgi:hypothetical protein